MATKEEAIKFLKDQIAIENPTVSKKLLNVAILTLDSGALDVGLNEEEIELCGEFISKKDFPGRYIAKLIQCMIPNTVVSQAAARNMIAWILSKYQTSSVEAIVTAMQWIIGILEYDLTDESAVDDFYLMYYILLKKNSLEQVAARLIFKLTKPDDVSRWKVLQVLNLQKKQKKKKKKHLNALLSLFKSYKPECVPETVPTMSSHFAFKKLPFKLTARLLEAKNRREALASLSWVKDIDWYTSATKRRGTKKRKLDTIPLINYIHFGSALYREEKRSVLEFNNISELGTYQLSLDMPANIMSLLDNKAGFLILAFESSHMQSRLSYMMYYTLYNVFIEQSMKVDELEKENLLHQIWAFEEYMQQGIPVVSRFLAEYLHLWNFTDFQSQIFHLVEWITFSSFSELYDCILIRFESSFVASNVKVKCDFISTLGRLMQNVIITGVNRKQKKLKNIFLTTNEEWNSVTVVKNLSKFIEELCVLGLTQELEDPLIFHASLSFYEQMLYLEEICNLPLWSIMPPGVAYRGLFTKSPVFMTRVCNILLRYKDVYRRLRSNSVGADFHGEYNLLLKYVNDYVSFLWTGEAYSNKNAGYIFKDVPRKTFEILSEFVGVNDGLTLPMHILLAPYIHEYFTACSATPRVIDRKTALKILDNHYPDIGEFLRICLRDISST